MTYPYSDKFLTLLKNLGCVFCDFLYLSLFYWAYMPWIKFYHKNALNNLRKLEIFRYCAKLLCTSINSNIRYGFENLSVFFSITFRCSHWEGIRVYSKPSLLTNSRPRNLSTSVVLLLKQTEDWSKKTSK